MRLASILISMMTDNDKLTKCIISSTSRSVAKGQQSVWERVLQKHSDGRSPNIARSQRFVILASETEKNSDSFNDIKARSSYVMRG